MDRVKTIMTISSTNQAIPDHEIMQLHVLAGLNSLGWDKLAESFLGRPQEDVECKIMGVKSV